MSPQPERISLSQRGLEFLVIVVTIIVVPILIFAPLATAAWFLPAPWHMLGAVPATAGYWFFQRDSLIETLVIFLCLLFLSWAMLIPVRLVQERVQAIQQEMLNQPDIAPGSGTQSDQGSAPP